MSNRQHNTASKQAAERGGQIERIELIKQRSKSDENSCPMVREEIPQVTQREPRRYGNGTWPSPLTPEINAYCLSRHESRTGRQHPVPGQESNT